MDHIVWTISYGPYDMVSRYEESNVELNGLERFNKISASNALVKCAQM